MTIRTKVFSLFFQGAFVCLLVGGCSTVGLVNSPPVVKLTESGGDNYFEYVLAQNSISFSEIIKSTGRKVGRKTIKLTPKEVDSLLRRVVELGVKEWLSNYGDSNDLSSQKYLTDQIVIPVASWSLQIRVDGRSYSSKGWGMFPSDKNYLTPSGPVETHRYEAVKKILSGPFNKGEERR